MIRKIEEKGIPKCVSVIRKSLLNIAKKFGITFENL